MKKSTRKEQFAGLLRNLAKQVSAMDEREFDSLLTGAGSIELKVTRQEQEELQQEKFRMPESQMSDMRRELESMSSRSEGEAFLAKMCKSKEDLIRLARYIDLPIQKSDKADQIRQRIIEATIGYRVRSAAIQGTSKDV